MFRLLKSMAIFGLKVLLISYLAVLFEELLNKIINWIYYKIKGISSEEVENIKMEMFYKRHGVQCPECLKWFPSSFKKCPLCNKRMSLLQPLDISTLRKYLS